MSLLFAVGISILFGIGFTSTLLANLLIYLLFIKQENFSSTMMIAQVATILSIVGTSSLFLVYQLLP